MHKESTSSRSGAVNTLLHLALACSSLASVFASACAAPGSHEEVAHVAFANTSNATFCGSGSTCPVVGDPVAPIDEADVDVSDCGTDEVDDSSASARVYTRSKFYTAVIGALTLALTNFESIQEGLDSELFWVGSTAGVSVCNWTLLTQYMQRLRTFLQTAYNDAFGPNQNVRLAENRMVAATAILQRATILMNDLAALLYGSVDAVDQYNSALTAEMQLRTATAALNLNPASPGFDPSILPDDMTPSELPFAGWCRIPDGEVELDPYDVLQSSSEPWADDFAACWPTGQCPST